VLDTNVVVSAVLTSHGTCARILEMLADGVFGLCTDDRILAEYEDVLHRPGLRIVPEDAALVLDLIRSVAHPASVIPLALRLPDAKDAPFLEVAAAADAILVTGNTRHFPQSSRAGITVLTPREFIDIVRRSP
jgi:putative PIN family toxin of toxin-antitoxin system